MIPDNSLILILGLSRLADWSSIGIVLSACMSAVLNHTCRKKKNLFFPSSLVWVHVTWLHEGRLVNRNQTHRIKSVQIEPFNTETDSALLSAFHAYTHFFKAELSIWTKINQIKSEKRQHKYMKKTRPPIKPWFCICMCINVRVCVFCMCNKWKLIRTKGRSFHSQW